MRLAFVSPLPPARSGIADYSAELVPHLAEHVDLELFCDRSREARSLVEADLEVRGIEALDREVERFDLLLYQIGNNADFHSSAYAALMRYPGVVVLHEFMLHHLVRGMTLPAGEFDRYVEEMRYCYGATGERLARRHLEAGLPLDLWRYPCFERVVDRSLALIVHNHYCRDRVLASRPAADVRVVPHHLSLEPLSGDAARTFRTRFGIPEEALLLASFGLVTPPKRLEVTLRAFAELRRRIPTSRYLVAGELSPYYDVDSLLGGEAGEGVIVTGRLELADLQAAMQAADVAVNLRYPTGGETSGTLMRLLGLGRPVVVSDHGAFAEVPDGCCAKVPLGSREEAVLTEYLLALAEDADLRARLGANARRHMEREHTLEGSAAAYAEIVRRVARERRRVFRPAPPLAPRDDRPMLGRVLASLGADLADLGISDADRAVDSVAARLVESGLVGEPSTETASRAE